MGRRIAIVEDEPAIRENYADVLRKHGYEVAAYASRPAAMQAFKTQLPSLALIDVGLGDEMDGGFTLCRDLRALSATLPIIFLTARDSDFDVVSGLRLGADDYLTKDVSLPHLLARIAALFQLVDQSRHEGKDMILQPCDDRLAALLRHHFVEATVGRVGNAAAVTKRLDDLIFNATQDREPLRHGSQVIGARGPG